MTSVRVAAATGEPRRDHLRSPRPTPHHPVARPTRSSAFRLRGRTHQRPDVMAPGLRPGMWLARASRAKRRCCDALVAGGACDAPSHSGDNGGEVPPIRFCDEGVAATTRLRGLTTYPPGCPQKSLGVTLGSNILISTETGASNLLVCGRPKLAQINRAAPWTHARWVMRIAVCDAVLRSKVRICCADLPTPKHESAATGASSKPQLALSATTGTSLSSQTPSW